MTDVSVEKQTSWGTTRDNLVLGSARNGIDGAHLLTPMAYLMTAGAITNDTPVPINILSRLNVNGQEISVSNEYKHLNITTEAKAFGQALAAKRVSGKEVRAAMTFPGGLRKSVMPASATQHSCSRSRLNRSPLEPR